MDLVDYDKHKTQKIPQKHFDINYESGDDGFYDSFNDNTDPGDEDGNQEDHLDKLDIETVPFRESVKQVFIQAVLLMP